MLYIPFLILATLVTGPFATDKTDDQFRSLTVKHFGKTTTENSAISEDELRSEYLINTRNISENSTEEHWTDPEEYTLSTGYLTTTGNISENSTQDNATYSEEYTSSSDDTSSTAKVSDIYILMNSTLSENLTTVQEIASTTKEISGTSMQPPSDYSLQVSVATQTVYITLTIVNGVFVVCIVAILVGAYICFRKLLRLKPDEYVYVENQERNTNLDMGLGDHQRAERGEDIELRLSDRRIAKSISRSRYSGEFHRSFDGKNRMTRTFQTSKDEQGEEDHIHQPPAEKRDRLEVLQTRDERPHRPFSKSSESQPQEERRVTSVLYRNKAYEDE
ncbi:hypothetical protein X975_26071, partial [Stegodyphus mimosarum]